MRTRGAGASLVQAGARDAAPARSSSAGTPAKAATRPQPDRPREATAESRRAARRACLHARIAAQVWEWLGARAQAVRGDPVARAAIDALATGRPESMTLGAAAVRAGCDPATVERHCRATTGTSFSALRAALALDAADRLLRRTRLPVAEVALDAGYASPASFARAFRRRHGRSPSAGRPPGCSRRSRPGGGAGRPPDAPGGEAPGGEAVCADRHRLCADRHRTGP